MSAPHRPSATPATSGFTLIELLVVITVIAILAAMITPAYFAVRRSAFELGVAQDMKQMEAGLENFKTEFGFYPSDFSEFVDANGDALDYLDVIPNGGGDTVRDRLLKFLAKISPTHNELQLDPFHGGEERLEHWWEEVGQVMIVDTTAAGAANKDNRLRGPQHALWFWLSQLYNDAQYPLTGQRLDTVVGNDVNSNGVDDTLDIVSEHRELFEFSGAQLVERTNVAIAYPGAGVEYPIYIPIQRGGDGPLVYFHNDTYIENTVLMNDTSTVINYTPLAMAVDPQNIAKAIRVPASQLVDGNFLEPKRFQIVAPGNDETFGDVEELLGVSYEKLDNIASFAEGRLDSFVTRFVNP